MDLFRNNADLRRLFYSKNIIKTTNFGELHRSNDYPSNEVLTQDVLIFAVALSLVRFLVEILIFSPIISSVLKNVKKLPFKNKDLESYYENHKFDDDVNITAVKQLSAKLKMPIEKINKWMKRRKDINRKQVKVKRCTEALFRLLAYSFTSLVAYVIITSPGNQEFVQDPASSLLKIFEKPPSELELFFFTRIQIPLYLHLLTRHLFALDSWEILIHHLLVLAILTMGYWGNFLYVLTYSMLIHDLTDVFLELSRLLNYTGYINLSALSVMTLSALWPYLRLVTFTVKVVVPIFVTASFTDLVSVATGKQFTRLPPSYGDHVLGTGKNAVFAVVCIILALNLYWTITIMRVCIQAVWSGSDTKRRERALTDLSTDDDETDLETDTDSDDDMIEINFDTKKTQ